jgi:hypothetical protein
MQYAGALSTFKTAEQSLKNRGISNLQSQEIIRLRNQLADITSQITALEIHGEQRSAGGDNSSKITRLRQNAQVVSDEIKQTIDTYYSNTHSGREFRFKRCSMST